MPNDNFNDFILNVLLLFLTLIMCSPNNNAGTMMALLDRLGFDKDDVKKWDIVNKFIVIGSTAFLNSFLIPTLVYNLSELMHFGTNSTKDKSKLLKYFVYLLINAIILPLAQLDQITEFLGQLSDPEKLLKLRDKFSENLVD